MDINNLFSVIIVPDSPEPTLGIFSLSDCPRISKALKTIEDPTPINTSSWEAEVWKDIEGYNGVYQVSSHGRVRSMPRTRTSKTGNQQTFSMKYMTATKRVNSYVVQFVDGMHDINKLVALAFVENKTAYKNVIWKDGNRSNNYFGNLEWGCARYLRSHAQEVKAGRKFQSNAGIYSTSSHSSRPIIQYTLNGEFVAEWGNSYEVMRCLNIGVNYIAKVCDGQVVKAHGFLWRYKKSFLSELSQKDGVSNE